jgi:thioredoxin-like negative regulator of GroEL
VSTGSAPIVRDSQGVRDACFAPAAAGEHIGVSATTEPKLLYFYSPKSGLSRRVEAFLDQVLQERRNHRAFSRSRVDVDRTPQLAEHFDVSDVPAIVVLEDGHMVRKVEGRVSVGSIRDTLSPWLQ